MTSGFGFLLLRLAIHRHLRRNAALTREDTATQHKHRLSLALYLIAIPTAFVHPRFALALIATVTLICILPPSASTPPKKTSSYQGTPDPPQIQQRISAASCHPSATREDLLLAFPLLPPHVAFEHSSNGRI